MPFNEWSVVGGVFFDYTELKFPSSPSSLSQHSAHQAREVSKAAAQQTTWERKLGYGANTCKFSQGFLLICSTQQNKCESVKWHMLEGREEWREEAKNGSILRGCLICYSQP